MEYLGPALLRFSALTTLMILHILLRGVLSPDLKPGAGNHPDSGTGTQPRIASLVPEMTSC